MPDRTFFQARRDRCASQRFPPPTLSTSLVRTGRNGVTHTSIRNRAGGKIWNMSAAQLDEAFYHLSLPCMSLAFAFIGKKCLALPTGMQRGGGFSLILDLSTFAFLFWAAPIPCRIIMSFYFSFRSPSFVSLAVCS